jgi:hypothetical protein
MLPEWGRMLNIPDETKTPYIKILQYYGIEMLLYRFNINT